MAAHCKYLNATLWLLAFTGLFFHSCKSTTIMGSTKVYAVRLKPGQDLKQEIQRFVVEKKIKAGWISTCVGSLNGYTIRFANEPGVTKGTGYFEIVSLTGTVSVNGSHIHISVSDSTGRTIGGHLADGNIIYTTAEIIISATDEYEFSREKDGTTPWEELQIKKYSRY